MKKNYLSPHYPAQRANTVPVMASKLCTGSFTSWWCLRPHPPPNWFSFIFSNLHCTFFDQQCCRWFWLELYSYDFQSQLYLVAFSYLVLTNWAISYSISFWISFVIKKTSFIAICKYDFGSIPLPWQMEKAHFWIFGPWPKFKKCSRSPKLIAKLIFNAYFDR